MSILDALTVLASGGIRGYRASQSLKREIAEARRRALLEERELATREQQAASQMALESSQTANQNVQRESAEFGLGQARRRSLEGQREIVPGGNFRADLLGNKVNLPGNLETLQDPQISPLLREILQGKTSRSVAETGARSRENVASTTAQSRRDVQTMRSDIRLKFGIDSRDQKKDIKAKLVQAALSEGASPFEDESEREIRYQSNLQRMQEIFPEVFEDDDIIRPPTNRGTTSGSQLSDEEAYRLYRERVKGR